MAVFGTDCEGGRMEERSLSCSEKSACQAEFGSVRQADGGVIGALKVPPCIAGSKGVFHLQWDNLCGMRNNGGLLRGYHPDLRVLLLNSDLRCIGGT